MGTVYITEQDAFIGKTDERLNVRANKKTLLDVPLIKIDGVVVMGRATVSPSLLSELLERKIPLSFVTQTGRYLGCLEPEVSKNIFVRAAQWRAAGETEQALQVVRGFIRGKLKNYRNSLLRSQREFSEISVQGAIARLEQAIAPIDKTNNINSHAAWKGLAVQHILAALTK